MGVRINPLIQDSFLGAYPSKSNSKEFSYTIPKHYISTSKTTGKQSDKFDQEETIKIPAGTFLFDDTLAFHKHPLKDPMPIRLLKILPEIDIQFQFRLNDLGGLSGQQKATLFKYLLNKYGAGAKTSSGYGQFRKQQENGTSSKALNSNLFFDDFNPIAININTADTENEYPVPEKLITKLPKLQETDTWIPLESLKNGSIVSGTVVDFVSGNAKIQLHIKEHIIILGLQGKFVLHNEVRLKIVETSGSLMKGNYQITKISKM